MSVCTESGLGFARSTLSLRVSEWVMNMLEYQRGTDSAGDALIDRLRADSVGLRSLLKCQIPLVLAGMGGVARSELVSAVTAAGGFGFLGMVREAPHLIEQEVKRVRANGHRSFGVNIIPAATERHLLDRQVDTIIDLQVPVVGLFWDLDIHVVDRLRNAGIAIVYQVGTPEEAVEAERAGAQIVIAQGVEAGGHVRGTTPLRHLLPEVVQRVRIPVLAAGGLAHGGDIAVAMSMGAQGVVMGTAFMATRESFAHRYHQDRLVQASSGDTILTSAFHINWPANAPVRVLRSPVSDIAFAEGEREVIGYDAGRPIYRHSTDSPLRTTTGDLDSMALYAGMGVGAIKSIPTAGEQVESLLCEMNRELFHMTEPARATSSPVCYASEFSGAYMGHANDYEIARTVTRLLAGLESMLRCAVKKELAEADSPFPPEARRLTGWLIALRQVSEWPEVAKASALRSTDLRLMSGVSAAEMPDLLISCISALLPRLPECRLAPMLMELSDYLRSMGKAQ